MTKSAADVAASARDEGMVTADVLLRTQTFQERLEQARANRARALQASGKDDPAPVTLSKPWEREVSPPAGRRPARAAPIDQAVPTLFFPEGVRPARTADPASPVASEAPKSAPALPAPVRARSPLLRTAIGFSLGLGLGLTLALRPWVTSDRPLPAATTSVGQTAVATAAVAPPTGSEAGAGGASLSAGPSFDVAPLIPASADMPSPVAATVAPAEAMPETAPAALAALPVVAPAVWLSETVALFPGRPEAGAAIPGTDSPLPVGLPMPVPAHATPEITPSYGMESFMSATAPLPEYAGLTIKVLTPAAPDTAEIAALTGELVKAGFPRPDVGQVGLAVSRTHVRFYHAQDAAAATALAASIGAEARDFTGTGSTPPDGLIELWIAAPSSQEPQAKDTGPTPKSVADKAPAKPAAKKPAKAKTAATKAQTAAKAKAARDAAQAADAAEAARVKARLLLLLQGGANP